MPSNPPRRHFEAGILSIAAIFFAYTLVLDLTVREIVLPYFLPGLHAGDGFLVGGDSRGFHEQAVKLAQTVSANGWSEWRLKPPPDFHAPVGIAAFIYALTMPDPIFLLPFNALIHSLSAIVLILIFRQIFQSTGAAIAAALPFLLLPTSVYWHSQLHKDGIYFLGMFCCLHAWARTIDKQSLEMGSGLLVAGWFSAGIWLVWSVREYALKILFVLAVIFACAFLLRVSIDAFGGKHAGRRFYIAGLFCIFFPIAMIGSFGWVGAGTPKVSSSADRQAVFELMSDRDVECDGRCTVWQGAVPALAGLDEWARVIARARGGYFSLLYAGAGSTIDRNVCIRSMAELADYVPRALQIGFFAPFPRDWISGKTEPGRMMRLVVGGEMSVTYLGVALAAIALLRFRRNPVAWVVFVFAGTLILLYSMITPNLGTLHRMRYGFLMLVAGLGMGYLFELWAHRIEPLLMKQTNQRQ